MHDRRCGEHSRPCPESESVHNPLRQQNASGGRFAEESWRQTFKLTQKLPYGLSYEFEDANGRSSRSSIGRSARPTGTAAAAPVLTRKRSPTSARSTCISSARPICTSSSAPQQFHFVAQPLGDHRRLPGAASNAAAAVLVTHPARNPRVTRIGGGCEWCSARLIRAKADPRLGLWIVRWLACHPKRIGPSIRV